MDTLTGTQKTPSAMKKAMKKNINKGENWRRFGKKKKAKQIIHLMTVVLETFQRSSLTLMVTMWNESSCLLRQLDWMFCFCFPLEVNSEY